MRRLRPEVWVAAAVLAPSVLTYGLVVGKDVVVTALVMGALCVGAILVRPFLGLVLFTGLVYVRPEDTLTSLQGVQLTLAVAVAALAGVWVQLHLNRKPAVKHPMLVCMVGFLLACVLSTVSGGNPVDAAMTVGKLTIMVWLILNLVNTPHRYSQYERALILLTGWVAGVVIYRHFTGQVLQLSEGERAAGTGVVGDPNDSAAVIAAGLALTLNAALSPRGGWRWLCWPLLGAMAWAIYLTQSRGGMLALMVAVGGTFFLRSRRRVLGLALGAMAAGALLAASGGRMTNFDSKEASANSRIWFWNNGIGMLISRPLLGVGFGQFSANNDGRAPHSTFVQTFGETGLVGYFCWAGVLYWAFRRPTQRPAGALERRSGSPYGPRLALATYLTAAFYLSHAYMTFLYILACLAVAQGLSHAPSPVAQSEPRTAFTWADAGRIAALTVASPLIIKLLVLKLG
jgi:O-antigen ligase